MKKIVLGIATVAIALCSLTGCGKSEEERFNEAKQSFDNFTATVIFDIQNSEKNECKFEIDGSACKITTTYELRVYSYYYKEQDGKVLCYGGRSYGWETTRYSTINDLLSYNGSGYLSYFQQFYYDDFEKDGDYLKMTNSALEGYSTKLGATLSSAKLTLDGSHFNTATAIIQEDSMRMQIDYKFEKYGKTSVTLPE